MNAPARQHDHWPLMARNWAQIGPPLRPSGEDVALYQRAAGQWRPPEGGRPPRVLIMGVTPELFGMDWPAGTDIIAVDHAQDMIDNVWPGPAGSAVRADWIDMPLPPCSRDIALCDGGLTLLAYPDQHRVLVEQLRRVLSPGGLFVARLFVGPAERETPDDVMRDLFAGRIPDLNALKLRLWTAMSAGDDRGVFVRDVWQAIRDADPDFERLARRLGWPLEHLLAINAYRDSPSRYVFPSVAEVRGLFEAGFVMESVQAPRYPLGERCPVVALRRAGAG